MKFQNYYFAFIIILMFLSIYCTEDVINLSTSGSLFYEEKYFRILSNNYEDIEQGITWTTFSEENGIGFQAIRDFGSVVLLKDWSMYNFKLTKIVFRPYCNIKIDGVNCEAEMWLYHTKDNNYQSPGRKIFLNQNFFVIIVQFKKIEDNSPLASNLFENLQLKQFKDSFENGKQISPLKPVKLYQIIQNQPSLLFEGKLANEQDCLFMVFTQYHFISNSHFSYLEYLVEDKTKKIIKDNGITTFYRNSMNIDEVSPMGTLLAYSGTNYFNYYSIYLLFIFLIMF